MGDVFDYLEWRGDLPLERDGFNPVDNLVLSLLSYLPLDGLVPASAAGDGPPLSAVAAAFFRLDPSALPIRMREDIDLLAAAAATRRFGGLALAGYVSQLDPAEQKQFAALTFSLGGGESFVAFRGTDLSLVGWKEDFNMTFLSPVPAQTEAAAYLASVAAARPGSLRLGGHSKGGNLAVYAAASAEAAVRARVLAVYNNDGPGFASEVLERPGFRELSGRMFGFLPRSSIVGLLLEHAEQYVVIDAAQAGLMQHDAYSWRVEGPDFVRAPAVEPGIRLLSRTLKEWLGAVPPDQRERFFDGLYEIVRSTGASSLSDLTSDWLASARAVVRTLRGADPATKRALSGSVGKLLDIARAQLETAARGGG